MYINTSVSASIDPSSYLPLAHLAPYIYVLSSAINEYYLLSDRNSFVTKFKYDPSAIDRRLEVVVRYYIFGYKLTKRSSAAPQVRSEASPRLPPVPSSRVCIVMEDANSDRMFQLVVQQMNCAPEDGSNDAPDTPNAWERWRLEFLPVNRQGQALPWKMHYLCVIAGIANEMMPLKINY